MKVVIPGRERSERTRNDCPPISTSGDCGQLFPVDDPAGVAVELHAAERAALVEIADRIGLELGVLAKILGTAGRAIAEVVGAMIVPPHALIVRGAVENLEVDVGMVEPDSA